MAPLLGRLGLDRSGFGFGRRKVSASAAAILAEYVFFAGDSGTLSVPAETTRIQVAGVAAGGGGFPSTVTLTSPTGYTNIWKRLSWSGDTW